MITHDPIQGLRGRAGISIATAAVFLLVAGIGAATSYFGNSSEATGSADAISSTFRSNDETLQRLADYARSTGAEGPASMGATDKMLPDVDTMIERLAARLKTAPDDVEGWQMLGWSYFSTGRFEQAASAYAKAVELDPGSAELKRAYEEAKAKAKAKAKASEGDTSGVRTETGRR